MSRPILRLKMAPVTVSAAPPPRAAEAADSRQARPVGRRASGRDISQERPDPIRGPANGLRGTLQQRTLGRGPRIEGRQQAIGPGSRHERVIARLSLLRARWPAAFRASSDPGPWPAMKVGIHLDIESLAPEQASPRRLLRDALQHYVSRGRYLAGLVEGAPRIDLDGEVAGVVTGEQAVVAVARLRRRLP